MVEFITGCYRKLEVLKMSRVSAEETELLLKTFPLTIRNSCVIKIGSTMKIFGEKSINSMDLRTDTWEMHG